VGGLVGGQEQIGGRRERDIATGGVRLRADRARRRSGGAADVGPDVADVVASERRLDLIAVRQRAAGTGDPRRGDRQRVALGAVVAGGVRRRRALDVVDRVEEVEGIAVVVAVAGGEGAEAALVLRRCSRSTRVRLPGATVPTEGSFAAVPSRSRQSRMAPPRVNLWAPLASVHHPAGVGDARLYSPLSRCPSGEGQLERLPGNL